MFPFLLYDSCRPFKSHSSNFSTAWFENFEMLGHLAEKMQRSKNITSGIKRKLQHVICIFQTQGHG